MAAPNGNKNHLKHGKRNTRLYTIWRSMRQRCYNPKTNRYKNYGGRGITVCEEWNNSFTAFHEWATANGYEDNLTLERKDVNGNYEPSNCRWATYKEQANNMSNSVHLTYNGETHTMAEWADITGIKKATIWERLKKGWSIDDALTIKPVVGANRH